MNKSKLKGLESFTKPHRGRLSQFGGPCRVEIPVEWKLGAAKLFHSFHP